MGRWKESGLSATQFAAETGTNARSLSWWKWRLEGGEPAKRQPRTRATRTRSVAITKAATLSPLSFVEMTAAVVRDPLEIVLPSSYRVRVPIGFDAATLGRVLEVLERRR